MDESPETLAVAVTGGCLEASNGGRGAHLPLQDRLDRLEMVVQRGEVGAQRLGLGVHARRQLVEVRFAAGELGRESGVLCDGAGAASGPACSGVRAVVGGCGCEEAVHRGVEVCFQGRELARRGAGGLCAAGEFEVEFVFGGRVGLFEIRVEVAEEGLGLSQGGM